MRHSDASEKTRLLLSVASDQPIFQLLLADGEPLRRLWMMLVTAPSNYTTPTPTQGARTWVLVTEAAERGWGIAGTAFGREEFAALTAKSSATTLKPSSGLREMIRPLLSLTSSIVDSGVVLINARKNCV